MFFFKSFSLAAACSFILTAHESDAFAPVQQDQRRTTSLHAIGVLAKKAKQMELRKYVEGGIEDSVKEKYAIMKGKLDSVVLDDSTPGPLQDALTKRKGTITVVAEYKRKMDIAESGYISDFFEPEILSPTFREFGASAISVMADEKMGGCNYDHLSKFVEEQRRAQFEVPGPLPVINNDLVIDELQIARSAAYGSAACVIRYGVIKDHEELTMLLKSCKALDMEPIVAVNDSEEAQAAVDVGARIILVDCFGDIDVKIEAVENLNVPEGQKVCTIANLSTRKDNKLQEIEEAWALRDKGFNSVWVSEVLYKAGNDQSEHPGAVIKAMKSKSSLKWASPKANSGRGEGAREYLGDILM